MGSFPAVTPRPLVHAVMATYRRPAALRRHLEVLAAGTCRPDRLLVVDNGADPEVRAAVVAATAAGLAARWVPARENLGPAGAFALGMSEVIDGDADDGDWLLLLDDDDPPATPETLAELIAFGERTRATHPRLGAVGLAGARFDARRGRTVRVPDHLVVGTVGVDHIGGNQLPCYRVEAVRDTGVFDPTLFFGFEELEYGLRLRGRGWELCVDGDAWYRRRSEMGRTGSGLGVPSVAERRPPWRAYYSNRNLVHLLRGRGHSGAAARVALGRVLPKAAYGALTGGAPGRAGFRLALDAVHDGWTGRLGCRVEPAAKVGVA